MGELVAGDLVWKRVMPLVLSDQADYGADHVATVVDSKAASKSDSEVA